MRVCERGEDLALAAEPAKNLLRVEAAANDFDRHLAGEFAVFSLGEINRAHPSAPDTANETVLSQAASGHCLCREPCRHSEQGGLEEIVGRLRRRDQFFQLPAHLVVATAVLG